MNNKINNVCIKIFLRKVKENKNILFKKKYKKKKKKKIKKKKKKINQVNFIII
jgi:hypothetical protein